MSCPMCRRLSRRRPQKVCPSCGKPIRPQQSTSSSFTVTTVNGVKVTITPRGSVERLKRVSAGLEIKPNLIGGRKTSKRAKNLPGIVDQIKPPPKPK